MKLSLYAKQTGICYRTAWRWFKAGKLPGFQADTGPIIVTDPTPEKARGVTLTKTAIYTRVSAAENKSNLEGQAKRLQDYRPRRSKRKTERIIVELTETSPTKVAER